MSKARRVCACKLEIHKNNLHTNSQAGGKACGHFRIDSMPDSPESWLVEGLVFLKTRKTRIPRRQPVCRQLGGTPSTTWGTPLVPGKHVAGWAWLLSHMPCKWDSRITPHRCLSFCCVIPLEGFRCHFCARTSQGAPHLHAVPGKSMLLYLEKRNLCLPAAFKILPQVIKTQ